jgi:serine protease SohB
MCSTSTFALRPARVSRRFVARLTPDWHARLRVPPDPSLVTMAALSMLRSTPFVRARATARLAPRGVSRGVPARVATPTDGPRSVRVARASARALAPRGGAMAVRAASSPRGNDTTTPDATPAESADADDAADPERRPAAGLPALVACALAASIVLAPADAALAADLDLAAVAGAPAAWAKTLGAGVAGALTGDVAKELGVYTLKTLIAWGVPAAVVGLAAFFAFASSRKAKEASPSGEPGANPTGMGMGSSPFGALFAGAGQNAGQEPSPFVIKRLNDKLDSYKYAFQSATVSAETSSAAKRRAAFADKYAATLGKLTSAEREKVEKAYTRWAREDAALRAKMAAATRASRSAAAAAAAAESKKKGDALADAAETEDAFDFLDADEIEDAEERLLAAAEAEAASDDASDASDEAASSSFFGGKGKKDAKALKKYKEQISALAGKRADAESAYVKAVAAALPAHKRGRLAKLLSDPRTAPGWEGDRDALALPSSKMARRGKPHAFVLTFNGDVRASQAAALREEVTAVLRSAKKARGDEVVLILNTGGGTVTGYGLAAAQLTRIRDAGLKLTVCVEQVAASGGYMMACVADRLVASPFAVLGSIGVISEVPNVYERLQREGIQFETVTAGKFKRTLTPTKKIDPEDVAKSKADIEDVLVLFKSFVAEQRPTLDIDVVATGETWFGADALKRGLCDELKTTDDVLLDALAAGAEIFSVKFRPPKTGPAALLGGGDASAATVSPNSWAAIRTLALGVAGFAAAAGGIEGGGMIGGVGGRGAGAGGSPLLVDAADAAEKVMARDRRFDLDEDALDRFM